MLDALSKLDEKEREYILLRFKENYSYDDLVKKFNTK